MSRLNLHFGEVSRIMLSPDGKYLISGGSDGTIFVMTMSDLASEPMPGITSPEKPTATAQSGASPSKHQAGDTLSELNLLSAEEQLSEIVLVRKSLMESWRKRQENLKVEMEEENNKVESSLRHEKYKYEQDIAAMEKAKTDLLNELNRQYEELQMQEAE